LALFSSFTIVLPRTAGIARPIDFVQVLGAGVLLIRLKLPPWLVILLAADAGYRLGLF